MNNFYKHQLVRREARIKKYVFITLATITLGAVPDAILGIHQAIIGIAVISPLIFGAYYFNKKNTDLSGTLLLLYITCSIFISNIFYGMEANNSYYYIAEYVMLLLVIDTRNKLYLIINHIHIGISILSAQFINFYDFKIYNTDTNAIMIMGSVNIILAVLASMYLFYTYVEENIAKENYLILMHKRINTKNKVIENAQVNLETFIYRASHNLQGPIRSIMGLYNISVMENNPERLKELIEMVNESAIKLDEELSVTAQIFKINQHIITLQPVNLYQFAADYYKTSDIETTENDKSVFNTLADIKMLTEGMDNLYSIFKKLRLTPATKPHLSLDLTGTIFSFILSFEAITLDDKYLNVFFAPYQKDLSYLYNLTSEPYICRRIMDKLHGDISIHKNGDNHLSFTVASQLI
jgi:phosphatidylserine synthase